MFHKATQVLHKSKKKNKTNQKQTNKQKDNKSYRKITQNQHSQR